MTLHRAALLLLLAACGCARKPAPATASAQCRSCHPAFYAKWSASRHGLAMQPYTPALAQSWPPSGIISIGPSTYEFRDGEVIENSSRRYPAAYVMGGKNAFYLLTPLDRGRLQVLPIAYDVARKSWYDVAASGVRPHPETTTAPLPWTDPAFTFNTSCYSCHVSHLRTNYDAASATYHTTFAEPGINCETCHGDASAHLAAAQSGKKADPKILRATLMTSAQCNETCAPCHAKMSPLSARYEPGQRFFDHYDLITLESADFYPDGRDLGENYTYTSWLRSGCARSGKLDCLHCHTSSGRFRFEPAQADAACQPCHNGIAQQSRSHTHHKNARCIDCHMPQTRFANMTRSDHSMRAPTPAATLRYQSPNACNLCHRDKDAAWADRSARAWYGAYQNAPLEQAALLDSARRQDWTRLPAMLAATTASADPVFATSMLRLLRAAPGPRTWPLYAAQITAPHPLIRAAAAAALADAATGDARAALLQATRDEYRLVRIRAAAALGPAAQPEAVQELLASYRARPDDFASLTNLGNFHLRRNEIDAALQAFESAIRLRPDSVGTLTNASLAYSRANRPADAERVLRQALQHAPNNATVLFNLGLLLAETARPREAESSLRRALAADPKMAQAAYNLAVIVSSRSLPESITHALQAAALAPSEARYTVAAAQFLIKDGRIPEATRLLESHIQRGTAAVEPYALLGEIHERTGRLAQAAALYRSGAANASLAPEARNALAARAAALTSPGSSAARPATGR